MSDLGAYWTTGRGSRPLRQPGVELTRLEAVWAFFLAYLAAPLAAAPLGAVAGWILTR